jgi:hypothetical protein
VTAESKHSRVSSFGGLSFCFRGTVSSANAPQTLHGPDAKSALLAQRGQPMDLRWGHAIILLFAANSK